MNDIQLNGPSPRLRHLSGRVCRLSGRTGRLQRVRLRWDALWPKRYRTGRLRLWLWWGANGLLLPDSAQARPCT